MPDVHSENDSGLLVLGVRNDGDIDRTNEDSQYSPFSVDRQGRLKVIAQEKAATPFRISANGASDAIKTGPGALRRLIITAPGVGGTLTIRDSLDSTAGPIIAQFASAPGIVATFDFHARFLTGLSINNTAGVPPIAATVVYD